MRKMRLYRSLGQSIGEYVLLLGIITVALLSMQVYMKRGIQAMIKVSADQLGSQTVISNRTRREANTTQTTQASTSGSRRIEGLLGGGQTKIINTTTDSSGVSSSVVIEDDTEQ